jgi:triacylglycerol esterase/lipase EstA (alpha/beta hydrolase family)
LREVGLATPSSKPFLFFAHSLGGIVVKQALVQIANSPDPERTLLAKVKRVIFFGVPNRGMQISHLLPIVKHRPNEPLIQALCNESPYLAKLDEQFFGIFTHAGDRFSICLRNL